MVSGTLRGGGATLGEQEAGQALVVLAKGADLLPAVEHRDLDPVHRPLERRLGQVVVTVLEGGFPGQVERPALEPRAQPIGRLPRHADRRRRLAHRPGGDELAQELGLPRRRPARGLLGFGVAELGGGGGCGSVMRLRITKTVSCRKVVFAARTSNPPRHPGPISGWRLDCRCAWDSYWKQTFRHDDKADVDGF